MKAAVVIGLGSSDSHAMSWLRRALAGLKAEPQVRILRVSPIYQSDAMLPEGAPPAWNVPYLNLAAACDSSLEPTDLLDRLKALEKKLGRQERERWAPREIDLDILAWGNLRVDSPRLSIPHRGLQDRPFALLPLSDVTPEWLHGRPEYQRRTEMWKQGLPEDIPFRTRKRFERLTELVAILNLTPDSFSDGSAEPLSSEAIARAAQAALDAGATVLDLGAESTRPGATPVSPAIEWDRLELGLRSIRSLRGQRAFRISIDSRHPETVARALETGIVDWINDVTGFSQPRMLELAGKADKKVEFVAMHSLGVPPVRTLTLPNSSDPTEELVTWGKRVLAHFDGQGIGFERVILDPGIGFGKTPQQNLRILKEASRLHVLKARLLVGHSRKSFLAMIEPERLNKEGLNKESGTPIQISERDTETAVVSAYLADQGIEYLRVHQVATQARALRLSAAWEGTTLYVAHELP